MFATFSDGRLFMLETFCNETKESRVEEAIEFAMQNSREITRDC